MEQDYLRLAFSKRYTGFRLEVDATFTSGVTAVFGPSGSGQDHGAELHRRILCA